MKPIRKTAVAAVSACALTALAAPVANAQVPPVLGAPGGAASTGSPCSLPAGSIGVGPTGAPLEQVCAGVGNLAFIGPTIGQVSSVVGPTVIGPAVGVQAVASTGAVVGSVP
jgi:hypothetical protein